MMDDVVLVHLAAGLGNIVLATPLLVALGRLGFRIDLWLTADYPETADLFRGWATVRAIVDRPGDRYRARIAAVPPFYWRGLGRYHAGVPGTVARPPDSLFWADEQAYYMEFARALGYTGPAPSVFLPVAPATGGTSVVLAPGCKTGEMAAKRWPYFAALAERFAEVVVVGTAEDLRLFDGRPMRFPPHARVQAGRLRLRDAVDVIATAAVVVANDSGLGHVAAALGVPTVLLFGPTPDRTLGPLPPNVRVMRAGLPCEPCWYGPRRFEPCAARIDCLKQVRPDDVALAVASLAPMTARVPQ